MLILDFHSLIRDDLQIIIVGLEFSEYEEIPSEIK